MSFILDALKKAEEERKKLESRVPFPGRRLEKKRRLLFLIIPLGLLTLALALLLSTGGLDLLAKKKVSPPKEAQLSPLPQKVLTEKEKTEVVKETKKELKEEPKKEKKEFEGKKDVPLLKPKRVLSHKTTLAKKTLPPIPKENKPSPPKEEPKMEEEKVLKLEKVDMEKINALFNEAQEMASRGRFDEAKRIYAQILSEKPDHLEALNNLGLIYLKEGLRKEALSLFGKSLSLKTNYPKAYNNIGVILAQEGENKLAEEYFKKAIELEGGIEPYINLANLLRSEKRQEEAERLLFSLLNKGVKDPNLYLSFALIKDEKGEKREAIKYYRAYLREADSKEQKNRVLERLKYLEGISGSN